MTFYTSTHPRARTKHQCESCYRPIRVGETYHRGVGMDEGTAWTWKECAHCEVLSQWLMRLGVIYGEDGYGPDDFGYWSPLTASDLRLKVNWRRKWTRRDGSLVPVPTRHIREDDTGWSRLIAVTS